MVSFSEQLDFCFHTLIESGWRVVDQLCLYLKYKNGIWRDINKRIGICLRYRDDNHWAVDNARING